MGLVLMGSFLKRVGAFSYRYRRTVVGIWVAVLTVIGVLAATFMGQLANSFSLPGTETERVLKLLNEELPDLAGGSGSVVFAAEQAEPFTEEQQAAIEQALRAFGDLPFVIDVQDPFETQAALDGAATQIEKAREQIADNEEKIADGRRELELGQEQLEQGRVELAEGKKELQENEAKLVEGRRLLEQSRPQLEQAAAELAAAEQKIMAGQAELDASSKTLDESQQLLDVRRQELEAGFPGVPFDQIPAAIETASVDVQGKLVQLHSNATELEQGIELLEQQLEELDPADPSYGPLSEQLEQLRATLTQVEAGIVAAEKGAADLDAARQGLEQLLAGQAKIDAGKQQVSDARQELEAGKVELAAGREQYNSGRSEFENSEAELAVGEIALAAGRQELEKGEAELNAAQTQLTAGLAELDDGEKKLREGKLELAEGERQAALVAPFRFVSENGDVATATIRFNIQTNALTDSDREQLFKIGAETEAAGVETIFSQEIAQSLNSVFGISELIGFLIAALVLIVILGTLIAAGLPLLIALVGVAAGVGGTLALSSVIDMQTITPVLALMLGLAVGIDYTLFIVYRHRSGLLAGMPVADSVAGAISTSGSAVVFAGATVVIALSALVVAGLPFLSILGLSAAFTVLMVVLLSLTLTPALLGFLGLRILTKKGRIARENAIKNSGMGADHSAVLVAAEGADLGVRASSWWSRVVTKHSVLASVLVVLVLGAAAIPAASMQTSLPDGGSEPLGSDPQRAFEVVSESFGEGFNGPLIVMASLPSGLDSAGADDALMGVAERLTELDGVYAAMPVATNDSYTYGAIQVIPTSGPSSPQTEALVHQIRDDSGLIEHQSGVSIAVTGQVAAQIDVSQMISAALAPYLITVVGLSLILLLLVFRSLLIPVLATGGFLLSLAAAFGATVAVYQWGWLGWMFGVHHPGPVLSFLPILLTGILFGLAMDYQVFLTTPMREAYLHGGDARLAVRRGFNMAAPVVVAAALIMISVFSGFVFSHLAMIRPLGFALAFGVLFDAFFVRMTFVPAILQLVGKRAWYLPKWMQRILPKIEVEG